MVIQDLKTNKSVDGKISAQILKEIEFASDVLNNCTDKSILKVQSFKLCNNKYVIAST